MSSKIRWSPGLIAGTVLLAVVVFIGVFAPMFLTGPANELTGDTALDPSMAHLLGTDDFGRDLLSRALVATRLTLLMAASATVIAVGGGLVLGITIWFLPSKPRAITMRILETLVAYPTLVFALVIAAVLGPGTSSAIVAIGLAGIPGFARVVSNLAASLMTHEYVVTARLLGVGNLRLTFRHLLPNMAESLLIVGTTNFAASLVDISGLSFIGLGVQPPQYDLGRLLNDSLNAMFTQPVQAVGPSVMIVMIGLSAMLIGDGLAANVDPRFRLKSMRGALKRLDKVSDPVRSDALVKVSNLTVRRGDGQALVDGVSFEIQPGEILALVGESGSGKSLTSMALAQLTADELTVEAGELRVGELDLLGKPSPKDLAKTIGVVYQDPGTTFNPALRMGSQLTEVQRTHLGQSRHEAEKRMIKALEKVSIREAPRRMTQHPHELSGGMRQRAMIASAMAVDTRLLIADEPTTALDVTVQAEVLRQFKEINALQQTAILFISHDLAVVEELCDRILVMKSGQIVESLDRETLKSGQVKHPYTRTLLDASPKLKYDRQNSNESSN